MTDELDAKQVSDQNARILAGRDAALHDLAMATSTYFKELIVKGIPEGVAAGLTINYQVFVMNKWEDNSKKDKMPQ